MGLEEASNPANSNFVLQGTADINKVVLFILLLCLYKLKSSVCVCEMNAVCS